MKDFDMWIFFYLIKIEPLRFGKSNFRIVIHLYLDHHRRSILTKPAMLQSFTVLIYIAIGTVSYMILRKSKSKALHWVLYLALQSCELWILMLVEMSQPFKFGCLYLIFNVGFIYIYILFANEIHVVLFNAVNFASLIIFSSVLYYFLPVESPPPLLSPFSVMVSVFFFVLWLSMYLYNTSSFGDLMYLKFPFCLFNQLAEIFQQNIF